MNLKTLSIPELHKVRTRTERFLYSTGVNVGMDKFEKTSTFIDFVVNIRKALFWQIEQVSTPENIERLTQISRITKFSIKPNGNREVNNILTNLLKQKNLKMAFEEVGGGNMGIFFKLGANAGGQASLDKLGVEGVFGVNDPSWVEFLKDQENLLINSVDNTTKRWIAGILQDGVDNHLTTLEIRDLLTTEGKAISKVRGEMIAQTELANVMNRTELEGYRRAGLTEKRYRTSRDERVCPICQPLDGKIIGIDQAFSSTVNGREYTAVTPPQHVMCRCFTQAVENDAWVVGGKKVWMGGRALETASQSPNLYPVNLGAKEQELYMKAVKGALENVPKQDLSIVSDIYIKGGKGPSEATGGYVGNTISIYLGDKKGNARPLINVTETIYHEIGHINYNKWRTQGYSDLVEGLQEEHNNFVKLPILQRNLQISNQITHGDEIAEFASEAYAQYRMYPEMLEKQHPSLFNLFKENIQ